VSIGFSIENVDTVRKYEHLIHRTIDQLEKLGFYRRHLDLVSRDDKEKV